MRIYIDVRLTALRFLRQILAVCLVLGVAACGREQEAPKPLYSDKSVVQDGKTHYVFSVHPLYNPQLLHQKYQPLMQYLGEQIPGTVFDLDSSNDYADFERKLKEKKADFGLPNPYHAYLSRQWGYHVMARMGNDEAFRGIFIVRKESPIQTPADLRGKVLSYPAPTALAAAMLPQLYLQNHGVDVETDVINQYVGTHNSAIMNAYLKQSAVGVTWPAAWKSFQQSNPNEAAELKVLWETPKLIQNAVVVRDGVPAQVVAQVQTLLVGLQSSEMGKALLQNLDTDGFVPSTDQDFLVVEEFLKEFNAKVKKQK